MELPPIVRCWCAPPGQIVMMPAEAANPCTWPDCVNRDKPDPNEAKEQD